nr:Tn3 family transposase [Streptomyces olivoverticillatus]
MDVAIADEEVGGLLRNAIGMERLRAAVARATTRLPRDHGHLAMLDDSYTYLRQFTPDVLRAISFKGGTGAESLMDAVKILKELNATGARKVPDGAPADFVPVRWAGYLEQAAKSRDVTAYRHFWELTVMLGLRDGLRSGDVYVPSSRRYADPASYLFTPEQWAGQREQFCQLVGKPTAAPAVLERCKELAAAMADLEKVLSNRNASTGEVCLSDKGELIIPALSAEDVPAEAAALKDELAELLPLAPIASLLVELDRRTGFLDCFTHAGGKQARSAELKRNLPAVLIGESLHSLRRDLHYAHQGKIRERFLAGQTEQAWCPTVLTNSVVTWTTEYYGLAIAQMHAEGRSTTKCSRTSPRRTARTSTITARSTSRSTPNSPNLTRPAIGHCEPAVRTGREPPSTRIAGVMERPIQPNGLHRTSGRSNYIECVISHAKYTCSRFAQVASTRAGLR